MGLSLGNRGEWSVPWHQHFVQAEPPSQYGELMRYLWEGHCELFSLKGCTCDRTQHSRKSKKTLLSTLPVVVYTSSIPFNLIKPIAKMCFPLCSSWVSRVRIPACGYIVNCMHKWPIFGCMHGNSIDSRPCNSFCFSLIPSPQSKDHLQ